MSIHVALSHITHYRYARPILIGPQVVRLRPAPHTRTPILSYALTVTPAQHFINWQQDPQSNYLARLVFPERCHELKIEVNLTAALTVINPFDFFLEPHAERIPFEYEAEQRHELAPYLERLPLTPRFEAYLKGISRKPLAAVDFLVGLNHRLQQDIRLTCCEFSTNVNERYAQFKSLHMNGLRLGNQRKGYLRSWRFVAQRAVRSNLVVVLTPLLYQHLCFLQVVEDFPIEKLIP